MANKSIAEGFEDLMRKGQTELLEALLSYQESPYPWNPEDPEAEAYFADLEREFELENWSEEEIAERSQSLFVQIERCWASSSSLPDEALKVSLSQRFVNGVPQAWLEAIAERARQVFSTNLSLADQLVACVRPLLSNWAEEDLLLFARPFAYAMRGGDPEVVRPVDWSELSEMERARLSMAIASYALSELSADD